MTTLLNSFNPIADDLVPPIWNGPHVGLRLCEAMRTLMQLPMPAVRGYGAAWPAYAYEFDDLIAQQEQGELEKTMRAQNRTRLLPSYQDVTRMETALCWPAEFLNAKPALLRAVNAVAFAHSIDRDAGWVAVKRGGYAETWLSNHDRGCDMIALGLIRAFLPVF